MVFLFRVSWWGMASMVMWPHHSWSYSTHSGYSFLFRGSFRLKINLSKSEIVSVGEEGEVDVLAKLLCCRVEKLPTSHLGAGFGMLAFMSWYGLFGGTKMREFLRGRNVQLLKLGVLYIVFSLWVVKCVWCRFPKASSWFCRFPFWFSIIPLLFLCSC